MFTVKFWFYFIKFLPTLISLIRLIMEKVENGITEHQIKEDIAKIEKAFKNSDRHQSASDLNDVFRL